MRSRFLGALPDTRPWLAAAFAVTVLALFAATVIVSNARYRFGDEEVIHNVDFSAGLDSWRAAGRGQATLQPADPPIAQLALAANRAKATLGNEFAPRPAFSRVRVAAEVRTRDVVKGPKPWNTGRLVVSPFNADGAFIHGRPHVLVSETGTTGWRRYDGIFPVADDVATVKIELQLLHASGVVEVRNLRVQEAFAVPEMAVLHRLIGSCWVAVVLIALFWLSRRIPKRGLWVCGALAVAMLVLVAPRPRDHVVRPVLLDSFIDAAVLAPIVDPARAVPDRAPPQSLVATPPQGSAPVPAADRPGFIDAAYGGWLAIVDLVRRFDHLDEYMHTLFLFAVAVFCTAIAGYRAVVPVGLSLLVLALVSELLQVFSLGRTFSVSDAGFNLIGVAAGFALYLLGRQLFLKARPARSFNT